MLRVKREKGEGGLPGWAEADPCLKHWSRFPLEPIKRTEYFPKYYFIIFSFCMKIHPKEK